MKFLIDTDIASYGLKGNPAVLKKMNQYLDQWAISSITYHELVVGMNSTKNRELEMKFAAFLEDVEVIEFTSSDAMESGRVDWLLIKAGKPIGDYDTLLAGQALNCNLTLVTNNEKHFSRVPDLRVANWAK